MPSPTVPAEPNTNPMSPPAIVVQPSGGGLLWRVMALLGWAGFGFATLFVIWQFFAFTEYFDNSHGITEKYHSGAKFARDKIAILSLEGLIADGEGFAKGQIDRIRDDPEVRAIVLRIDSPGGTVTASDYLWHHLKKLRRERQLPMVVSMGAIAASGGYYVAMAVEDQPQSIYAEPTTTTGSIGVMLPHYDFSGLLQRFDVRDDSLVTHARKEMGSMTKPMPEDHRQLFQAYIDESFARFKEVVRSGRPKFKQDPEALDRLATGEIFSATAAKNHGLVDEIGFLEDALERVAKLANLSLDSVRVVKYERPVSLLDLGVLATASRSSADNHAVWLELATPRPYFLVSTLPPMVSSHASQWIR